MSFLNALFTLFDELIDQYEVRLVEGPPLARLLLCNSCYWPLSDRLSDHGTARSTVVGPSSVCVVFPFSQQPCICPPLQVYKIETAGDCYIVAGALMHNDDDGFIALDPNADEANGAEMVMSFSKVRCSGILRSPPRLWRS